ncbi:retrovirus-related pol polyprotein from transposon TNT 1-94 [Tanacetum coccineum]
MYGYNYMKKIVLRRADLKEYVIAERDFKYMYPSDFEDLYLLNLQGHLNHLSPEDKKILTTAVNLWTRNFIRQRVETSSWEIGEYQTQLNIKPNLDGRLLRFEFKHDFTIHRLSKGIFLENRRYGTNPGMHARFWTKKDVDRSKDFMFAIQKRLKTRRIFRNLESFVGGRIREGDYRNNRVYESERTMKREILLEANFNNLLEILLKMNLPDHRIKQRMERWRLRRSRKMARKPYSHQVERATYLLGLIHTDVCGPFKIMSRQGAYYFISFTDDFSHYGYVYFLKHKHEVFETFKVFQKEVENQLGKTIKLLCFDRGGYPKETMGYSFYYPPENKVFVAQNAEFFENDIIDQEASGCNTPKI